MLLLSVAVITSAYGVLLISSATKSSSDDNAIKIQLVAIILGIISFFILTIFDIEHLSFLWKAVFVLNLLNLSLTLFFGVGYIETGNNSWIRFSLGTTNLGFQPGELGKILFIFTLAMHFKVLKEDINKAKGLIALMLHCLIPTLFVLIFSKDDGMASSYLLIFVTMSFAAGIYLRYVAIGFAGIAAAVPFLWTFFFSQYQRDRFIVLFDSAYKLDSVGYHQRQSVAAIQSGGFWGDGLYNGTITQTGHLPTKSTDFIFSVACEELGFFGGFIIIFLLLLIVIICVSAAIKMRDDKFSMLVCVGVASMITFQTFLNIGMNLRLAPVVGLTLPFVSYGGTSILTMFLSLGIVASLKRHYIKRSFSRNMLSNI